MGVLARIDGRCGIVEYSDLPDDLTHKTDAHGRLVYGAGNPAIHLKGSDVSEAYEDVVSRFLGHDAPMRFTNYEKPGLLQRIFGGK